MEGRSLGSTGGAIGALAVAIFTGLAGPLARGAALPGRSKAAPVGPGQPNQLQTDAAEALGKSVFMPVDLGDGVSLPLVLVPAGSFRMGSSRGPLWKTGAERPAHEVVFNKPFYMGIHEVTQEQWEAVMGPRSLPSMVQPNFNPANFIGRKYPVIMVCWNTCQEFVRKLSERTELKFSLPSEAEWEYACRAGKSWEFCFGDKEDGLRGYAWYGGNSNGHTHPVATRSANLWGLFDMHGNVSEWCEDVYNPNYTGAPADGSAWLAGRYSSPQNRVVRGGSWESAPGACRSAARERENKGTVLDHAGLRVVLREF